MAKVTDYGDEDSDKIPLLIKSYGEYWNPDLIDWDRSWRLLGKHKPDSKGPDVNVYEERGVYVLYNDFVPVYVGKAFKQSLGYRLQLHWKSPRKRTRWDRFSWFGLIGLNDKNELQGSLAAMDKMTVSVPELIATLEALLILVVDPRMNARREKFKNATQLFQSTTDERRGTEARLDNIEKTLQEAMLLLKEKKPTGKKHG